MTLHLTLHANFSFEFAFGKVTKGKEMQVFGEYFPVVAPVLAEFGSTPIGSFAVISTNRKGVKPEMGSFTQWSSAENFNQFYQDERFTKVRPLRDEALELLSDGHFFTAVDKRVEINLESDYAIIISTEETDELTPLISLVAASNSPEKSYLNKTMTLSKWNEKTEALISASNTTCEVFRIRFNEPVQ